MTELTYVLTDIHGRLDLLELALAEIERRGRYKRLIFLGDYVDRGPQSRQVVDRLIELQASGEVICLAGNHEQLFVEYVACPTKVGGPFLTNGGRPTLANYTNSYGEIDWHAMRVHAEWMKTLPLWFRDEKRTYVHAGIRPGAPMETQTRSVLLWSRLNDFFNAGREEMGAYIVHGHTSSHENKETDDVEVTPSRTNLDTCAHETGVLTIGVFDEAHEQPIETFRIVGPRFGLSERVREHFARALPRIANDRSRNLSRPQIQPGRRLHAFATQLAAAVARGRL